MKVRTSFRGGGRTVLCQVEASESISCHTAGTALHHYCCRCKLFDGLNSHRTGYSPPEFVVCSGNDTVRRVRDEGGGVRTGPMMSSNNLVNGPSVMPSFN